MILEFILEFPLFNSLDFLFSLDLTCILGVINHFSCLALLRFHVILAVESFKFLFLP